MMYCHDPRISNDRNDRRLTDNPALIQAEIARQLGFPVDLLDWDVVANAADASDWPASATELLENQTDKKPRLSQS